MSTCLSRGISTPEMRAIGDPLPLLLLVLRVRADHHHVAVSADDLALLAARLYGRTDFHRTVSLTKRRAHLTKIGSRTFSVPEERKNGQESFLTMRARDLS